MQNVHNPLYITVTVSERVFQSLNFDCGPNQHAQRINRAVGVTVRHNFCFLHDTLITIIMYIYHALINALSTHIIHIINLNTIFSTEDSPTKTIYIRHFTHTHTHTWYTHMTSKNWVVIQVYTMVHTGVHHYRRQFGDWCCTMLNEHKWFTWTETVMVLW